MEKKDCRFELVMTKREYDALATLADRQGVSLASVIRAMLRRVAKRKGVWK